MTAASQSPSPAPTPMAADAVAVPARLGETRRYNEAAEVWRRLLRNRGAVIGLAVLVLLVLMAVCAPLIAPDQPLRVVPALAQRAPSPERLLAKVAKEVGGDDWGVAGLHVFTFNQVAETEAWRRRLLGEA